MQLSDAQQTIIAAVYTEGAIWGVTEFYSEGRVKEYFEIGNKEYPVGVSEIESLIESDYLYLTGESREGIDQFFTEFKLNPNLVSAIQRLITEEQKPA